MDALSLHSCFLEAFRVSRIDPSRQVSMSAARAASPGFTEGQNIKKVFGTSNFGISGEGGQKVHRDATYGSHRDSKAQILTLLKKNKKKHKSRIFHVKIPKICPPGLEPGEKYF